MKFKGIAEYCEFEHCKHFSKCSLALTPEKRDRIEKQGETPEIRDYCVYLDHNFKPKEK